MRERVNQPVPRKDRHQCCADTNQWPRIAPGGSHRALSDFHPGIPQFRHRIANQRSGMEPGLNIHQRSRQSRARFRRLYFCDTALRIITRHGNQSRGLFPLISVTRLILSIASHASNPAIVIATVTTVAVAPIAPSDGRKMTTNPTSRAMIAD